MWWRSLSRRKKWAVVLTPILIFLIATPLLTYAYYARDISNQERLMNRNNTGIVLNDKDGKAFYSVGRAEHRKLVPLDQISPEMKDALLASEDKDFYKHGGFSPLSIAKALVTNVASRDATAYGGSTLTQQLAKNTLLSNNKSFLRKYQELAVSVAIERNYTKDQILEMYLNSVFYGENAFGIEDAARTYFNKAPKDLDLAESAMLVGVLPAPSAYSPISGNPEFAKQRQKTVLSRMESNGKIASADAERAAAQELEYASQSTQTSIAPHFAEMVIKELSDRYGYERVMRSGYQVQTTLDAGLQSSLNENVAANMAQIQRGGGSNAGAVAIDPQAGQVRALVGSADYNNADWGKVNMATTARQPGSSFKPIYYAGALAEGVITPATVLHDKPINLNGWQPNNADRRFRGDITARSALNQSLNIPAIEVMQKYGVTKSVQTANTLGLSTLDVNGNYGLALALGAGEVPLMQLTNAYAAFANGGQQSTPAYLSEVKDKFGKQIYRHNSSSKQVISQAGAFLISDILSDNGARAPMFGNALTVPGKTVAVKTGTTDDSRDAWTVGYSPSLAVGVWVGNNDNTPMYDGGSRMAGPIWRNTMTAALSGKPDQKFVQPGGVVSRATCYSNHGIATNNEREGTYNEYYLSSALPSTSCTPEKPKPIEVCTLADKRIESIDEKDFDGARHSRDLEKCKTEEPKKVTIQVCELATGKVITIDEKDFKSSLHSRDMANCKPPVEQPEPTDPTVPTDPTTPTNPTSPTPTPRSRGAQQ